MLACKVMVRVMVEVRVTSTVQVRARVRDQKPISRDCSLASELVQAKKDCHVIYNGKPKHRYEQKAAPARHGP